MMICSECGTKLARDAPWCLKCGPEVMTQHEFNKLVVEVLHDIATSAGISQQFSEPKHGIMGDPIRDKIYHLEYAEVERAAFIAEEGQRS